MCNQTMRGTTHEWWDSIENPYDRLSVIGKYLVKENPETTIYDLLNFIREEIFLGQKYDDGSDFIMSIDFDIEYEHGYSQTL